MGQLSALILLVFTVRMIARTTKCDVLSQAVHTTVESLPRGADAFLALVIPTLLETMTRKDGRGVHGNVSKTATEMLFNAGGVSFRHEVIPVARILTRTVLGIPIPARITSGTG